MLQRQEKFSFEASDRLVGTEASTLPEPQTNMDQETAKELKKVSKAEEKAETPKRDMQATAKINLQLATVETKEVKISRYDYKRDQSSKESVVLFY